MPGSFFYESIDLKASRLSIDSSGLTDIILVFILFALFLGALLLISDCEGYIRVALESTR